MKDRCIGFIELQNMNPQWRDVLHLGVGRHYAKGESAAQKDHLFFLEKGTVRLIHTTRSGKEKILWQIGAGCTFNETPFFDPLNSTVGSVHVCVEDCEIYAFSRACVLERIFVQRPDLQLTMLASLARKVRMLSNQASSLYVDEVLIRLCKFLAQRLEADSQPPRARAGFSRQELPACWVCTAYPVQGSEALGGIRGAQSPGPGRFFYFGCGGVCPAQRYISPVQSTSKNASKPGRRLRALAGL